MLDMFATLLLALSSAKQLKVLGGAGGAAAGADGAAASHLHLHVLHCGQYHFIQRGNQAVDISSYKDCLG